ncbi:MAG: flagellar biosynthetic protein FliO [Planctomycetes bacterium]|nr:flagellar biosynthetic protein FliO [Planctomycetota bacterium]
MKSTPKWLLIPPAVALLLVLGPVSMSGGSKEAPEQTPPATEPAPATAAKPATTESADGKLPGSLVPRTPDMWKMSSALVGVLLLGAGGLLVLKKLRGGASPTGTQTLATLRQTVRLGNKQSLHAIEFDNRILLVGESDKGLTLIESGTLPEAVSDEAAVLARTDIVVGDDDEGATPKNLLIPRPEQPAAQAATQAAARQRATHKPAANRPTKADLAIAKLNDFRTMLEKAAR